MLRRLGFSLFVFLFLNLSGQVHCQHALATTLHTTSHFLPTHSHTSPHTITLSYLSHSKPQALLEGISLSQPQPKIPPELIKFLGKSFSAWHIAIPLLESHVIIFPDESRCFDALAELYKQVGGGVCGGDCDG